MNNKLETKYIEFVKELSHRRKYGGSSAAAEVLNELVQRAKELHAELMRSGYGK